MYQTNKSEKGLEKNSQLLTLSLDELSEVVGGKKKDKKDKEDKVERRARCRRCRDEDLST